VLVVGVVLLSHSSQIVEIKGIRAGNARAPRLKPQQNESTVVRVDAEEGFCAFLLVA
jgi:hypothetical protein